jgi:hypothetical protein
VKLLDQSHGKGDTSLIRLNPCSKAAAYYKRYISGRGARLLLIYIRRFRCRSCRKTISLLPSFAQPYRLIQNRTLGFYVNNTHQTETSRWKSLLRPYWRRYCRWSKHLIIALSGAWGRSPPTNSPIGLWRWLETFYGGFEKASNRLIIDLKITFFGKYRCHQPNHS